jgi:CubicO group peptidase (beta-lactamase class C family)
MIAVCWGCGGPAPVSSTGSAGAAATSGSGASGTGSGAGGDGAGGGSTTGSGAGGGGATGGGGAGGSGVPYPVPDWSVGTPAEHGMDPVKLEAAAAVAEQEGSYCLLVLRHGVLISEQYWKGHDKTTPEKSWSIAKSYTSALVGIALDRGDIQSLDQSVADYVPEWKGTEREAITIKHLLSMTSGLKWDAFQDYVSMVVLSQDHTKFAVDLALDKEPGTTWTYHNGAVQVFERVFRNATGETIEMYAQKYLWSKLGTTASWAHDPAGNPTAYASVLASCRDHARMGYLYLHGGQWAGEQVISSDWIKSTLTPSQPLNRAYGYLWWLNGETPAIDAMMAAWPDRMVPFAPADLFAMRGFGNQFVDVIPSLDLMVVRFGPDPMATFDLAKLTTDQKFETHDKILKPVLEAVVE